MFNRKWLTLNCVKLKLHIIVSKTITIRSYRHQKNKKETVKHFDPTLVTNLYKIPLISSVCGTVTKTYQLWDHKLRLSKFQDIIVQSMLSHHNRIKLEVNKISRKAFNICK